eukprot:GILK01010975.1.p1 GENE.GILK01010975.1~~GILK01010975.1.p1  ORF type:complete len:423 (-),score=63.79 GILK01010975.1:338-1606(-)
MEDVLGQSVISKDGAGRWEQIPTTSTAFSNKVVGILFSAHWCPPSRAFTVTLSEFYQKFKKTGRDELAIVYCSSDRDEAEFRQYFDKMPWMAIPFSDISRKKALMKRFSVTGVPTLVLLATDGRVITHEGRAEVMGDPEGKLFPWNSRDLWDILGDSLRNTKGECFDTSVLRTKEAFFIYFSANWHACKVFNTKLLSLYTKLRHEGRGIEVLFVSLDRDNSGYDEFVRDMPWLALPFGDARTDHLLRRYHPQGLPTVVVLDPNGHTITSNGRLMVTVDGEGREFPWWPKSLAELNELCVDSLSESVCFVTFMDGVAVADRQLLIQRLQTVADKYQEIFNGAVDSQKILFLYGLDHSLVHQVREFLGITVASPVTAIFDIRNQLKSVWSPPDNSVTALTVSAITEFVESYRSGTSVRELIANV